MAGIFRKTALERLSSPDRLDSMLKVTSPMSWLGLVTAAMLVIFLLIWSFTGGIPSTMTVTGILGPGYNTNTVYSTAAGTVKELFVSAGEAVEEDSPVLLVWTAAGREVTVFSGQKGMVSKVLVEEGEAISSYEELLRISPDTDSGLAVVCYVDLSTAKTLAPGTQAVVYPASGNVSSMEAVITNVDRYVASTQAMCEVLGEDGQMAQTMQENGPVVAVTCVPNETLTADEAALLIGEETTVELVLSESSPISMVIPTLGGE